MAVHGLSLVVASGNSSVVAVSHGGGFPCRGAQGLECRLSRCDTEASYPNEVID